MGPALRQASAQGVLESIVRSHQHSRPRAIPEAARSPTPLMVVHLNQTVTVPYTFPGGLPNTGLHWYVQELSGRTATITINGPQGFQNVPIEANGVQRGTTAIQTFKISGPSTSCKVILSDEAQLAAVQTQSGTSSGQGNLLGGSISLTATDTVYVVKVNGLDTPPPGNMWLVYDGAIDLSAAASFLLGVMDAATLTDYYTYVFSDAPATAEFYAIGSVSTKQLSNVTPVSLPYPVRILPGQSLIFEGSSSSGAVLSYGFTIIQAPVAP